MVTLNILINCYYWTNFNHRSSTKIRVHFYCIRVRKNFIHLQKCFYFISDFIIRKLVYFALIKEGDSLQFKYFYFYFSLLILKIFDRIFLCCISISFHLIRPSARTHLHVHAPIWAFMFGWARWTLLSEHKLLQPILL